MPIKFSDSIRTVGCYQYCVIAIFGLGLLASGAMNMAILLLAPRIGHRCADNSSKFLNLSDNVHKSIIASECERPNMDFNLVNVTDEILNATYFINNTIKCTKFSYDHSQFDWTATEQYNLVCDRKWLISFASTGYMLGYAIGASLSGYFSDKFGRRPTLIVVAFIGSGANFLSAFAPNIIVYIFGRLVMGIADQAFWCTSLILSTELVRRDQRVIPKFIDNSMCDVMDVVMAAISILMRNYQHLHLLVAVIYIVLVLVMVFFVCESPRWLAAKHRLDDASQVIERIAHFNKIATERLNHLNLPPQQAENGSVADLFRNKVLRRRTLLLIILWLSTVFVRYAIVYNLGSFSSDVRFAIIIGAAIEAPSIIPVIYVTNRFGRQITTFSVFAICGVICLSMIPLVESIGSVELFVLAIFGKVFSGTLFFIVFVFTQEMYPTPLRNLGVGTCSSVSRIAGMVAPQITLLNDFWSPALVVTLGVVALLAAAVTPLLPDTSDIELAQSVEESEQFKPNHKYSLMRPRSKTPTSAQGLKKLTELEETEDLQRHC